MCAFGVFKTTPKLDAATLGQAVDASASHTYLMEDEDGALNQLVVWEVDLDFPSAPSQLEECLAAVQRGLLASGAVVVWLGFEGSFDFQHLLSEDVANQIYGVAAGDWVEVNLGDDRWSDDAWAATIRRARSILQALVDGRDA